LWKIGRASQLAEIPINAPERHIGTPASPGSVGGRINPGELDDNCVACVAAVLHNKFNVRGNVRFSDGRNFFNAHDMAREFEAVGRYINPVEHEGVALAYFERHLGLRSTYDRLPSDFAKLTSPGHYVLISGDHIIYGRVFGNGRRFLYDPQFDEVLTWQNALSRLGTQRPSIHQIIRDGGY